MTIDSEFASLDVLALDAFHGGSHRQFLHMLCNASRHRWNVVGGQPVHWKWRMRSAPLELAVRARQAIESAGYPDVVFCTDMLDLPQWRGLVGDARILQLPTVVYFHENQWTYPLATGARVDFHFGYTNLLTAIAADACWFNSQFHLADFLSASQAFVRRMPDARGVHDFAALEQKCQVLPPGFIDRDRDQGSVQRSDQACDRHTEPPTTSTGVLTLGWVSRWEADKRPDRFVELLSRLDRRKLDFRLVLLGPRPRVDPPALEQIRSRYAAHILHDGFAPSDDAYWGLLQEIDVVVATADHEFFGIAVCEAIWAGAAAVLPNRLSYPELVPQQCLYGSLDEAVDQLQQLTDHDRRQQTADKCRQKITPLRGETTTLRIDAEITRLCKQSPAAN